MLPKIPVPPNRQHQPKHSVYGGVGEKSSRTLTTNDRIDLLFPPIHSNAVGSAREGNLNGAKETLSRKSMRLLEEIKNAAKMLVDDVHGPEQEDSLMSKQQPPNSARGVGSYPYASANAPSAASSARRTVSSGPKKQQASINPYSMNSHASKAVANNNNNKSKTRITASGGGIVMDSDDDDCSMLLADAMAASAQQKANQPNSARRPEPISERLQRIEQRMSAQFDTPQQNNNNSNNNHHHRHPVSARTAVVGGEDNPLGVTSRPSRGMSPTTAMRELSHLLVEHEIEELAKVKTVYFAGKPELAARRGKHSSPMSFDNDQGDYKIIVGDHIAFRYEVLQLLGSGSFAHVVKAMDHKHNALVALKIVKNKKKFHDQAKIECTLLEFINKHCTNSSAGGGSSTDYSSVFVRLRDSFVFRSHVVMCFDLHGLNLYDRMKQLNFASTPVALIQSYATQLLHALAFLRVNRIIHCDIKPENILLKSSASSASVRLADFGSSTFESKQVHTYICSRFYRCPTIVLGVLPYTCDIDAWSCGCVLFELFTGAPLFPAQSEMELLGMITARLGPCPAVLLDRATRKKHFYEPGTTTLKKSRPAHSKMHPIKQLFPPGRCATSVAQEQLGDLISKLVTWDPRDRLTPAEALKHPFVTQQPFAAASSVVPKPPASARRKM